jgi:hypothetical protein
MGRLALVGWLLSFASMVAVKGLATGVVVTEQLLPSHTFTCTENGGWGTGVGEGVTPGRNVGEGVVLLVGVGEAILVGVGVAPRVGVMVGLEVITKVPWQALVGYPHPAGGPGLPVENWLSLSMTFVVMT